MKQLHEEAMESCCLAINNLRAFKHPKRREDKQHKQGFKDKQLAYISKKLKCYFIEEIRTSFITFLRRCLKNQSIYSIFNVKTDNTICDLINLIYISTPSMLTAVINVYIGRFLCLAYTIISPPLNFISSKSNRGFKCSALFIQIAQFFS
jgi:hypothetical protein